MDEATGSGIQALPKDGDTFPNEGKRGLFVLTLLLLAILLIHPAYESGATTLSAQEVENYFDDLVGKAVAETILPGAVVAVVEGERSVLVKGYGVADMASGRPVDAERTLFRIGSITKVFTAVAILQLVDEGKVDLDEDVNSYLKSFKMPATYPEPVTLRHLLSLKAGLDTDVTHMARSKDSATGMGPEEMARSLVRVRPSGIIMGYEDMGTGLLGIVLQEVDGKPYREVIRDRILVPLGMTRTVVGLPDDRVADVSRCHEITSHGELKFCEHQLLRDLAKGAGDLSTTAGDMAIFLKALANKAAYPGGSLLQPETFGQFTDVDQNRFHPQMPGFGLLVAEDGPLGRGGVGFGGGIAGFVTIFFVSLSDGVGVFVGLNAIPGQFSEAMSRNLTGLFNFITAPPPAPKTVAALNSMFVILELTNDFFARFLEGGEVEAVTTSAAGGPPLIGAPDLAMLSGRYIPIHAVSFGSFIGRFAAGLLFPVTRVEVTRDNALTIGNGGPYEQTLPSLFEDSEARDRVAFKITGEGVLMARLSPRTTGGLLIKLAWHDNPLINILPGGIFMIILLAAAVPAAGGRGPTRRLGRLAFGSAAIFVICLMLEMEFATRVIRVEGWPLVAALWRLPLQVAVIGFAALPVLAVIHRRQVQALAGNWGRGYLLALGLSGAGLAVLAGYWGLIGNLTGN